METWNLRKLKKLCTEKLVLVIVCVRCFQLEKHYAFQQMRKCQERLHGDVLDETGHEMKHPRFFYSIL